MDPRLIFFLCLPFLCGTLTEGHPSVEKRIIHGTLADEGELPYQVSLQYRYDYGELRSTKNGGYCGGALISPNIIATATHCTKSMSANRLQAVIGTNNLADQDSPVYEVDRIINGNYDANSKQHDISLLRIVRRGDQNRKNEAKHAVEPVPICEESFDPEGLDCVVSGFGYVKWHKTGGGGKLRKAQIKVLHYETCTKMLEGHHWDPKHNSMLCAGSLDKDACQGDSGGPLVCPTPAGGRCLAGVVSWGVGCATPGFPGVYTNIRNYDMWINKNIECNRSGVEECRADWKVLGKEEARRAVEEGKEEAKVEDVLDELETAAEYKRELNARLGK